ncbi:hypothetical protein Hanom_Chr03g00190361 [Helianthus anomalus]
MPYYPCSSVMFLVFYIYFSLNFSLNSFLFAWPFDTDRTTSDCKMRMCYSLGPLMIGIIIFNYKNAKHQVD